MSVQIITGDCRDILPTLPAQSVHCCVTSPPYWALRDYGCDGQMGLEPTPDDYVAGMVSVFRKVRDALRDDGTLWLNMGDSYVTAADGSSDCGTGYDRESAPSYRSARKMRKPKKFKQENDITHRQGGVAHLASPGLKNKDMVGIPWRVAFALQADGWFLRSDIIWHKPNPMPESVTDRPTKSHEYIFLLTKSARYYYDADAIKEPAAYPEGMNGKSPVKSPVKSPYRQGFGAGRSDGSTDGYRNKRSVWTVSTRPYGEAHFATFPEPLISPCILAGCPKGGTVLDPFGGSGTVGRVSEDEGRNSILIELNPEYVKLAEKRTSQMGLFSSREET